LLPTTCTAAKVTDLRLGPERVLHERRELGNVRLGEHVLLRSAQGAARIREEQAANRAEALQRVVAAVVGAVAVRPLVVSWSVDERVRETLQGREDLREVRVVAAAATVLDVPDVHHAADVRRCVDRGDQVGEVSDLCRAVRRVADDGVLHLLRAGIEPGRIVDGEELSALHGLGVRGVVRLDVEQVPPRAHDAGHVDHAGRFLVLGEERRCAGHEALRIVLGDVR